MEYWFPVADHETVLEESISLQMLFPLHQTALPPQVQKQLYSNFFLFP